MELNPLAKASFTTTWSVSSCDINYLVECTVSSAPPGILSPNWIGLRLLLLVLMAWLLVHEAANLLLLIRFSIGDWSHSTILLLKSIKSITKNYFLDGCKKISCEHKVKELDHRIQQLVIWCFSLKVFKVLWCKAVRSSWVGISVEPSSFPWWRLGMIETADYHFGHRMVCQKTTQSVFAVMPLKSFHWMVPAFTPSTRFWWLLWSYPPQACSFGAKLICLPSL